MKTMSTMLLFAQAGVIAHWAIVVILICGIVGIALVVVRATGIVIPSFIITILWIVLACFLGIAAIKFIAANL